MIAVERNDESLMKELIERGDAAPLIRNRKGQFATDLAPSEDCKILLRLLQEKQAERKMAILQVKTETMTRNPIESIHLDQKLVATSRKYSGKLQQSPCAKDIALSVGRDNDGSADDTVVPDAHIHYGTELHSDTIEATLQQHVSAVEAEDEREDDGKYKEERLEDDKVNTT